MDYRTVPIETRDRYDVTIGGGLLGQCGELLRDVLGPCRAAVITDTTVEKLYLDRTLNSLESAGFAACACSFPAGEQAKNMATLADLLEFLAENRLTRADCVIALGGGVAGDLAGFAAGSYLRGIRFAQLPTTLLAAVDSSVGGKTGVNLKAGKNLAGLFLQPKAVICDTDCLATLSPDILADGVAEAIKTGVLAGGELFGLLEQGWRKEDQERVIAGCVAFKGGVVQADEQETGLRRLLNLGHTVGHAVEKLSGYAITHGHAVAMGLAVIARAASRLGYCSGECADRMISALTRNGLPTAPPFSPRELAEAALADKKRAGNGITLVMPREIGGCVLEKIPMSQLPDLIRAGTEG